MMVDDIEPVDVLHLEWNNQSGREEVETVELVQKGVVNQNGVCTSWQTG